MKKIPGRGIFNTKRRFILKSSVASLFTGILPEFSRAQSVSAQPSYTPDDLKGQLTPFGAVRAGNADGTIPAWTGGGYPMPAGYQPGDPRPIPFADEHPLFVITSANMAQYADRLSTGLQGIFRKFPDFTMQVFPTHRTAIAPQYVYDYTYQNASTGQVSPDGDSLTGVYGGLPFPLPKNGQEVIWNHQLVWTGITTYNVGDAYTITSSGEVVLDSRNHFWVQCPYYMENGRDKWNGFYQQALIIPIAPPYEAGGSIVRNQPVDFGKSDVAAWEYLVGQRRVRRAPELQFDTPNSLEAGIADWDETYIFQGKLHEYDWNYTGVREMFVPYNTNKVLAATVQQQFNPHFMNPDFVRWELHRCRVVEASLRQGQRNVDSRRIIYCDEDTGGAVLGEVYDGDGELWKVQHSMPTIYGDIPCVMTAQFFVAYDLHAGDYAAGDEFNAGCTAQWKPIAPLPNDFFTPGHLAAASGGY